MILINKAVAGNANNILGTKVSAFKEEIKLYGFVPPGFDSIEELIRNIRTKDYYKII
jgi:hypothetical protein